MVPRKLKKLFIFLSNRIKTKTNESFVPQMRFKCGCVGELFTGRVYIPANNLNFNLSLRENLKYLINEVFNQNYCWFEVKIEFIKFV